jgi:tetratricopeptide (TPR) repeat protein
MTKSLLNFLAGACLFFGTQGLYGQTNSQPAAQSSVQSTDILNGFVQMQAQLHEAEMIVESNREQSAAALLHNEDALSTDIQILRADEADSARGVEHTMLMVAGVGMFALAVVVTLVYMQLRAATRLVELAMVPGSPLGSNRVLPVVETTAALPASARAALEFSNARLLGVIERLEKRILELEQTVHLPLEDSHLSGTGNGSGNGETISERRITDLIVEGQLFLDTNKPEKALVSFEEALEIEPKMGEALIKKATALEKLQRIEEAIACYDQAIATGDSTTTALLQKGGMLNRLARYDEALQCYERALQTQEKKAATS